jgi:hypothetical protein
MKIDEVPSLAKKARIATHTHIKVRLAFVANGAGNLGASAALTDWIGLDWIDARGFGTDARGFGDDAMTDAMMMTRANRRRDSD